MLFTGNEFKEEWLKYSNNFSILNENTIYLGPNGIGKTTTYNTIKQKHPDIGFFSYDDCKEKIIKEKKKLKISIRTIEIEKLKNEKQDIINALDLKTQAFKKHNITSGQKASEYSNYCKEVFDENEKGILEFENNNLDTLLKYNSIDKKKFILQNSEELKILDITGNELNEIRDKYILSSLENLEKAVDEEENVCPVCGCEHNKSILSIYKERYNLFNNTLNKLIDKYRVLTNRTKLEIQEDIVEMTNFVKNNNINDKISTYYILIGENEHNIKKLIEAKSKIIDINEKIEELEKERNEFFNNLKSNWKNINKDLQKAFKDKEIKINLNSEEKSVTLNLAREAKTYSTGELNYIIFLLNILEFEYSNKKTIVLDDPLSSYDIKKQYEIAFDIINRLIKNNQIVIIFTHNLNLVNIINSQYSIPFTYKSIDLVKNTLCIYDINLPKNDSILNIENLLNSIPNQNKLKIWLKLLIEKDTKWESDFNEHQLFHYDSSYSHPIHDISNDDLVELIDSFKGETANFTFETLSLQKIIYLSALRVWLEKQMKDNLYESFKGVQLLYSKIDFFFKHKDKWKNNLNIEKEELMRKKVLLNQNEHYKSQIIPFHYALSISWDDIVEEILELKELFKVSIDVQPV